MVRAFFSIFLLLIITSSPTAVLGQQLPDSVSHMLKKAIEGFRSGNRCPGMSIAIVREGDIIYSESAGYTDMDNRVAATIDSKFPVMSITKVFTATVFVRMVEQGLISMNDDIRKYVPEYRIQPGFPDTGTTTLLQLATHSSGLQRNTPADIHFTVSLDKFLSGTADSIKPFSTNAELLGSLPFLQLEYPAFDNVHHNNRHYSNLGYSILGIALERAAGEPFQQYVFDTIFQPLQMMFSGFLSSKDWGSQVAKGYKWNQSENSFDAIPSFQLNSALYAGGMYSTARDMAAFISSQFGGSKILSGNSLAMMRYLKIGWKPAYPYVLHEGALPGYRSIVVVNPDNKTGWVILTNGNDVDFNELNGKIATILTSAFNTVDTIALKNYTGTYKLPGGYGSLRISIARDTLYSSYLSDRQPMIQESRTLFRTELSKNHSINYEFVAGGDSEIKAVKMGQFIWYKLSE